MGHKPHHQHHNTYETSPLMAILHCWCATAIYQPQVKQCNHHLPQSSASSFLAEAVAAAGCALCSCSQPAQPPPLGPDESAATAPADLLDLKVPLLLREVGFGMLGDTLVSFDGDVQSLSQSLSAAEGKDDQRHIGLVSLDETPVPGLEIAALSLESRCQCHSVLKSLVCLAQHESRVKSQQSTSLVCCNMLFLHAADCPWCLSHHTGVMMC